MTNEPIDRRWHLENVPKRTRQLAKLHKELRGIPLSLALAELVEVGYAALHSGTPEMIKNKSRWTEPPMERRMGCDE